MAGSGTGGRFTGWRGVALTGAVMLAILLVLDFSAAQVCRGRCEGLLRSEHAIKFRVPHPVYHHDLLPRVRVMDRWGEARYPLVTNGLGFKDDSPREVPRARGGARRLLLIGDSFTEGVGVEYPRTFAGRMAEALRAEGWEVLNAAVSSYAPAVYFAKVKHLIETVGLEIDHVLVLIDGSDIYDEAFWYRVDEDGIVRTDDDDGRRRVAGKDMVAALRDNSILVAFALAARDAVRYHRDRMRERPALEAGARYVDMTLWRERAGDTRETAWLRDPAAFEAWGRRGVEAARRHMGFLKALLDGRGIGLDVAAYPWPHSILTGDHPSPQADVWRAWSAETGAGFIDLFPVFIDGGNPEAMLRRAFIPYDVHWNEEGHRMVADALLAAWRTGGRAGPAARPSAANGP